MNINAGDGNDTVKFSGTSITSTKIDAGAGDDRIEVGAHQLATLTGGAGADIFSFIAGAHATITDFDASVDKIELKGVSASSVSVKAEGGSTLIDLGGGASIQLTGVTTPTSVQLAYA